MRVLQVVMAAVIAALVSGDVRGQEARAGLAAELVAAVKSADTGERNPALTAIGAMARSLDRPGDARSAPSNPGLRQGYDDYERRMAERRDRIVESLAPAVPSLVALVEGSDEWAAGEAVWALGGIGPRAASALPAIRSYLADHRHPSKHRQYAPEAIRRIAGADAAVGELTAAMDGEPDDALMQVAYADALTLAGSPTAPRLAEAPRDRRAADAVTVLGVAGLGSDTYSAGVTEFVAPGTRERAHDRIVAGCVAPTPLFESVRSQFGEKPQTLPPPWPLRIVAVRISGERTVLDTRTATFDTGASITTCSEIGGVPAANPTRFPILSLDYMTLASTADRLAVVTWKAAIDTETMQFVWRYPYQVAFRSGDAKAADELQIVRIDPSHVVIAGMLSGQEIVVPATPPRVDVRFANLLGSPFNATFGPAFVVPPEPVFDGPWLRLPVGFVPWGGASPQTAQSPLAYGLLAGVAVGEYAPKDPAERQRFFRAQLSHPWFIVRTAAAAELAKSPAENGDVLPAIVNLLTTRSRYLQFLDAALKPFGAAAVPLVARLLSDPRDHVARAAVLALGTIGEPAHAALASTLDDARLQLTASETLERVASPAYGDAVPGLARLLAGCGDRTKDGMICFHAIRAIGGIGPAASAAAPALKTVIAARAERHRSYDAVLAAGALFRVGDRQAAIDALTAIASDPNGADEQYAGDRAIETLTSLVGADALPALIRALEGPVPKASAAAARAIAGLHAAGARAIPAAERLLRSSDPAARRRGLTVLAEMNTPDANALVAGVLRDPDPALRDAAFASVRGRGADALPLLVPLMAAGEHVTDILGVIRSAGTAAARYADAVLAVAFGSDALARRLAAGTLAQIGPVPPMQIDEVASRSPLDATTRLAVTIDLLASKAVSTNDAVGALTVMLRSPGKETRLAALGGLKRLGPSAGAAFADVDRVATRDPDPDVRQAARALLPGLIRQ